ncbi:MAG: SRPBCC family protein [Euzebya sp.]
MELTHTFTVPVPPEQAFVVLQDIQRIGPCMPGATIDSVDGTAFTGTVKVKIGPIKVTYQGEAEYSEVDSDSMTAVINARGKESRGSGTANATITAKLTKVADGSEVHVVTDLAITGRPAQFGRGVMEEVGQKLINQFADCLAEKLGEDEEQDPVADQDDDTSTDAGSSGSALTDDGAGSAPSLPQTSIHRASSNTRHEAEAIDLLDVAGASVAKRAAPALAGLLGLTLLLWWLRRR